GQVLDVGDGHHGRLALVVDVGAEVEQGVVDPVDGHLVLVAVGGRRQEGCGEGGVGLGVAATGRGAGHGGGPHDVAAPAHQQLGGGGDAAVAGGDEAPGVGGAKPGERVGVHEGLVGLDGHLAGQLHLVEGAGGDRRGGPGHEVAPLGGRAAGP